MDKLLEKISRLNNDEQKILRNFVNILFRSRKQTRKRLTRKSISKEKIIGMWENRDDMKNSSKWVREMRLQQWKYK